MGSEETIFAVDAERQKNNIRQIIEHQKSLYLTSSYSSSLSSSFSSDSASAFVSRSSFSGSSRRSCLLELMKDGNASLRRLFEMEHTSLSTHFKDYSGSPMIKPILLWGSESDDGVHDDPWMYIRRGNQIGSAIDSVSDHPKELYSGTRRNDEEPTKHQMIRRREMGKRKLTRKKTFRKLPRFRTWRCRGFGIFRFMMLRLRRLRVMICGRRY